MCSLVRSEVFTCCIFVQLLKKDTACPSKTPIFPTRSRRLASQTTVLCCCSAAVTSYNIARKLDVFMSIIKRVIWINSLNLYCNLREGRRNCAETLSWHVTHSITTRIPLFTAILSESSDDTIPCDACSVYVVRKK
jgi:hypothetical protein